MSHKFTAQNTHFRKNMLFTQRNMGVGLIIYNLDFVIFMIKETRNEEVVEGHIFMIRSTITKLQLMFCLIILRHCMSSVFGPY